MYKARKAAVKQVFDGMPHPPPTDPPRKVLAPLRTEGLGAPSDESIFVVDNSDAVALRAATGRARLCLNCTGPYRFLGEAVVSACVESG